MKEQGAQPEREFGDVKIKLRLLQKTEFRTVPHAAAVFQGFDEDADGHCDTIVAVAEVIKLTDPSLLYLEVSTLVSKYPDIR